MGRFISEDPIGLQGGINLYASGANDPVNNRDPFGLDECRDGGYHLNGGDDQGDKHDDVADCYWIIAGDEMVFTVGAGGPSTGVEY